MALTIKYLLRYKRFLLLNLIGAFGFIVIELGIPTLLAQGISNNFDGRNPAYMTTLAVKMLICAVVGLILLLIMAYAIDRVTSLIVRDIRNDLFTHIQRFSADDYERFGVSRLITNTGNDAYMIMQFLTLILRTGFIAPLMLTSAFVLIFRQNVPLALISIGMTPIIFIAVYFINKRVHRLSAKQQKGLDNINQNMRENLTGLRVIRAFNKESFQTTRFASLNTTYRHISDEMYQKLAFISPIFSVVFCTILVLVINLGSLYISRGELSVGSLSGFIEYIFHALFSFLMLGNVLILYPRFEVSTSRIQEIFNTTPTILENPDGVQSNEHIGHLAFDHVSFSYGDGSEERVLDDISFTAEPGQVIAFIGSTGSGKSTLARLIPRLFDVSQGKILIDGVDVQDYQLQALRKKISYVPQKATLFAGTIRENLLFGDQSATDEDLASAVEIAQAKAFIDSLPEKYDTVLAEGGSNLSGGQKQRLCIARALVKKAPIYLFDDSFSALDYKTDANLRRRLNQELATTTMIIVAQRISTIRNADKIIVLNEGQIVGTGTHRELLITNAVYQEIAKSQLTEEELAI
ncbi:ABC transporter ATP-binding protein [Lactococcus paracarnosus]|uniref:ABC transporter ATP-binding protein n=1 Tax=Pseudolactococcus paracarnosus TaxID=2749962 RepID=A0ABT0AIR3_9LACT|nr:ABC transporter ATP-binding protein [Lactococcus paracarnosus]MCJ1976417.1 ABC transporter ATP-binding protein [Lactococcus paracarnosus]MCJ1983003.1 ABC transporter ATP-binding protein [Lactococcus paracarnosus]MCJ1997506.1 ABC transporter ATP-binding protein [Lactococcus paracarnosus]